MDAFILIGICIFLQMSVFKIKYCPMVSHHIQNNQDCEILVLIWGISEREQYPATPFCLHSFNSSSKHRGGYTEQQTKYLRVPSAAYWKLNVPPVITSVTRVVVAMSAVF